ncbi:MAG: cytochrome b N-terminal domain-containing protein, partial [Pirellulales bacterium]|nr:cytochrome b N-terminal domain-containing protein [Pirellulales bacterium]
MIAALLRWLDDRTGIRELLHAALYEHIPGGARYRYVWGSTLVFAFVVQAMTGIVLWMGYSPSGHTAWESVYYIQYEMVGGWLVRGLHHFMAQAMVVLLAVHFAQVVIDGAYRAPREVNFWLGLLLLKVVLGLALTGYLLPWDQKGYWATRVATNLMGMVPMIGTDLQKLVVGGTEYGHHTLTRFFAMHAGVLPALLVVLLAAHVALFRRHGLHVRQPLRRPDTTFWPDQVLKDAVACLGVLAVVLLCVVLGQVQGVAW